MNTLSVDTIVAGAVGGGGCAGSHEGNRSLSAHHFSKLLSDRISHAEHSALINGRTRDSRPQWGKNTSQINYNEKTLSGSRLAGV